MPIREFERARYPVDWKAISAHVRCQAGNQCEQCGVPNGILIRRGVTADGVKVWRFADDPAIMDSRDAESGDPVSDSSVDQCDFRPAVRVVLTVAHLDHQPENCELDNLRALCQRCHLAYDAAHHAANASATRRARRAVADLFDPAR